MQNLELSFASKDSSFSVRSFSIEHRLGAPFEISLVALSPLDDVELEAFVGLGATLRIGSSDLFGPSRAWTGIVSHMEQVEAESSGLSTYFLRIVPDVWRTTRRRNNRIFQHLTAPEIASKLLAEWEIKPILRLDEAAHAPSEYRVQYSETDFAFLSRTLEDAGITYWFRDPDFSADAKDPYATQTALILGDEPQRGDVRPGALAYFNGKDLYKDRDSIGRVIVSEDVRPGRLTVRDYDFRSRPDFQLIAEAKSAIGVEARLEHYDYLPGAFVVEPTGHAARFDDKEAKSVAHRRLDAERQGRKKITFRANVLDLAPGGVFTIDGHPRRDLSSQRRLLVTRQSLEGTRDGEWDVTGEAVFADEHYRPMLLTPKPRIAGVQSALVVGPHGEEIHCDEFGRVRVQFHWDREGKRDAHSSCWIRVSQPWAGRGFGMIALPRVGEEVLVGFFDGDPDQPVIVGRVFNSASRVPNKLPSMKTRSTWKTDSSPGSGGYNEISLDDAAGQELMLMHAERDHERVVKNDESVTIGACLSTAVGDSEEHTVEQDQSISVSGNRSVSVGGVSETSAGEAWSVKLGPDTGTVIYKDKRIVFTTGEASIVLDGPNIYLDGASTISLSAGDATAISGGEVHIDGGPNVYVNSAQKSPPSPMLINAEAEAAVPFDLALDQENEAAIESLLNDPVEEPEGAPEALVTPAHVDQQLTKARSLVLDKGEQLVDEIHGKLDDIKGKALQFGENLVPKVEAARKEINARIDALRGKIEAVKAEANARIKELEAQAEEIKAHIMAEVALVKGKIDDVKERIAQAVHQIQDRIAEIRKQCRDIVANLKQKLLDAKAQVKAAFDALKKKAIEVRNAAQNIIDEVKATIAHVKQAWKDTVDQIKQTIENAKKEVQDLIKQAKADFQHLKEEVKKVFGDIKKVVKDVKALVKSVKGGPKAIAAAFGQLDKDWNQTEKDEQQLVSDAKSDAAQLKQGANKAVQDAEAGAKKAEQDAQKGVDQAKKDAKKVEEDAKKLEQKSKEAAQLAKDDAKKAADAAKQAAQDPGSIIQKSGKIKGGGPAGFHGPIGAPGGNVGGGGVGGVAGGLAHVGNPGNGAGGLAHPGGNLGAVAGGGGLATVGSALGGSGAGGGLAGSTVVTRAGGFGGEGVAHAINGSSRATFLQSPTEGQLMILRTKSATPISPADLSREIVEHQMNGVSSGDAMAGALEQRGYAVYERPWDSSGGEFVKKAFL